MAEARAVDGTAIDFDDDAVDCVSAPYPSEPPGTCHLYVDGAGTFVPVAERAEALVTRLRPTVPLACLTRPDGAPLWVRRAAVTLVQPATAADVAGSAAVLTIVGRRQAVREPVAAVEAALHATD